MFLNHTRIHTINSNSSAALPDELEKLARKRAGMRMGWFIHLLVFVSVNLLLAIVSAASGEPWMIAPSLGWGLGLAIHGAVVFLRSGGSGLHEALVARERERLVSRRATY